MTTELQTADAPFLQKVMVKGQLADIYDARDLTEVVFRTMRDLMATDTADRVAQELHQESLPAAEKALQNEVSELWQDTNLLVRFLSRLRPPLEFDDELFMRRIAQEGGLPRSTNAPTAIQAVFAATKAGQDLRSGIRFWPLDPQCWETGCPIPQHWGTEGAYA
jgi:uncharacterized protein (DUF2267 family)